MGRARPAHASPHRDSLVQPDVRREADDLDGRPAASAGVRAALVDGILDRPLRRQRTRSTDDASEAGLVSAKRRTRERSGDARRVLRPPRRSADAHGGRHRSGLSRGAAGHDHRLLPSADRSSELAVPVRRRRADPRPGAGRRAELSVRPEPVRQGVSRPSTSSRRWVISAARRASSPRSCPRWPRRKTTRRSSVRHARAQATSQAVLTEPTDGEIHIRPVRGNVYLLVGDGGNIVVQVGNEGAFVVDTGTGRGPTRRSRRSAR